MAGPRARRIVLSETQRSILQGMVRRTHCPQAIAVRAEVLLAAEQGLENTEIARRLSCHRDLPRRWRSRFAQAQADWADKSQDWDQRVWREKMAQLLEDRERCGAPPTFTAEQFCQIAALACEKRPEECGRPVTHWTARELADEAVQRHIVVSISPRHVGRFLKGGGPAAAQGAALAEQSRPAGKARRIPAALCGGGRGLSGRPGSGQSGRTYHQHG